jgi:hypothetical protein
MRWAREDTADTESQTRKASPARMGAGRQEEKMIQFLDRLFCMHKETVRKTDKNGRLYLECLNCRAESTGIYTGPQHQPITEEV